MLVEQKNENVSNIGTTTDVALSFFFHKTKDIFIMLPQIIR